MFDVMGTYEYTEKPQDLILEDVTRRLKTCRTTASEIYNNAPDADAHEMGTLRPEKNLTH
jgi:hypothetical protein